MIRISKLAPQKGRRDRANSIGRASWNRFLGGCRSDASLLSFSQTAGSSAYPLQAPRGALVGRFKNDREKESVFERKPTRWVIGCCNSCSPLQSEIANQTLVTPRRASKRLKISDTRLMRAKLSSNSLNLSEVRLSTEMEPNKELLSV